MYHKTNFSSSVSQFWSIKKPIGAQNFNKVLYNKSDFENQTVRENLPESQNATPITILKREHTLPQNSQILHPVLPYHHRWLEYMAKRNKIFEISSVNYPKTKPKRSTLRIRQYFKNRKTSSSYVISSIFNNLKDHRYYAKVNFLDFTEHGLLDTGANISCIGSNLAMRDFTKFNNFHKWKTSVKTADGSIQKVLGYLDVDISFKNQVKRLKLLIVPSLSQRLILGLDF